MFCLVLLVNVSSELYLQYISLLKVRWKTGGNSWEEALKLVLLFKYLIYETSKTGVGVRGVKSQCSLRDNMVNLKTALHGACGSMWAEAGKMGAAPFPAAKHTLISLSQLRNCTFGKCPLGLIWSFSSSMGCSLLPLYLSFQAKELFWFGFYWLAIQKFIHRGAYAVRADLGWGWQATSITFPFWSFLAVSIPMFRGTQDLEPVLCDCVTTFSSHSLI